MSKAKTRRQAGDAAEGVPAADAAAGGQARLKGKVYRSELAGLQVDMFKLQTWIAAGERPVVVVLEGLGPAGKQGTAEAIAEGLHRRLAEVVRLDPPRKRERQQWYFQRYVERLPATGKLVIFDGGWYHYPAVERGLGLCSVPDFAEFLDQCASFEKTLTTSGVALVKYWFAAGDQEQDRRFRDHIADLVKQKQFYLPALQPNCEPLPVAELAALIVARTDRPAAPWYRVRADDKRRARLNCMYHLLSLATDVPAPASDNGAGGARVPELF